MARKKSNVLHVGFVLDRSFSMNPVWGYAIGGLNDYIRQLADDKDADTTLLTVAVFDDQFEIVLDNCPVPEAPTDLGARFGPRGNTALYDAVAKMAVHLDQKVGKDKALLVVLTDGFENRSTQHTRESLASLVTEFEAKGNWTFVYLGANDPNVKVTADAMGFQQDNAAYYSSTAAGYDNASVALASVTLSRKASPVMASSASFADAGLGDDLRDNEESSLNHWTSFAHPSTSSAVDPFASFKKE